MFGTNEAEGETGTESEAVMSKKRNLFAEIAEGFDATGAAARAHPAAHRKHSRPGMRYSGWRRVRALIASVPFPRTRRLDQA